MVENNGRVKIRAHHLIRNFMSVDRPYYPHPAIRGIYGTQMGEEIMRINKRLRKNPDLEIEIISDFDVICGGCPKGPNKAKYVLPAPEDSIYPENDPRNPQFWALKFEAFKNEECSAREQRNGDRDVSKEDIGLPIGTVISARQACEISRIYNKYQGLFVNSVCDGGVTLFVRYEQKLKTECRRELLAFYEQEGIKHCFPEGKK
jgi:hypothetical protein